VKLDSDVTLHFNPCWDDSHSDKRFDKVVAAAKGRQQMFLA
jgi:hypothetical protein